MSWPEWEPRKEHQALLERVRDRDGVFGWNTGCRASELLEQVLEVIRRATTEGVTDRDVHDDGSGVYGVDEDSFNELRSLVEP